MFFFNILDKFDFSEFAEGAFEFVGGGALFGGVGGGLEVSDESGEAEAGVGDLFFESAALGGGEVLGGAVVSGGDEEVDGVEADPGDKLD